MRTTLLLSLLIATPALAGQTSAPAAPPAPARPTAQPAPAPARQPAQPAAARLTLSIVTTNPRGTFLPGVRVDLTGPVPRDGETDAMGTVRFTGMRAGTYRARFSSPDVITFEREIALRAGQPTEFDVTLNAAERKPEPPPAPVPEAPPPAPAAPPPA